MSRKNGILFADVIAWIRKLVRDAEDRGDLSRAAELRMVGTVLRESAAGMPVVPEKKSAGVTGDE